MITPRIYVGTYGAYNSGSLRGKWFDLDDYSDKDEFLEAAEEWHREHGDPDPELMFQDWEYVGDCVSQDDVDETLWDYIDECDLEQYLKFHKEYYGNGTTLEYAVDDYQSRFIASGDDLNTLMHDVLVEREGDDFARGAAYAGYDAYNLLERDCTLWGMEIDGTWYIFNHG